MVIAGGDFKPDTLKPKEVVSLLLDDEEMETRCKHWESGFNMLWAHEQFRGHCALHVF